MQLKIFTNFYESPAEAEGMEGNQFSPEEFETTIKQEIKNATVIKVCYLREGWNSLSHHCFVDFRTFSRLQKRMCLYWNQRRLLRLQSCLVM